MYEGTKYQASDFTWNYKNWKQDQVTNSCKAEKTPWAIPRKHELSQKSMKNYPFGKQKDIDFKNKK